MTDYENKDPNNEYMHRPSMKQDDHPEHNMPPSEHNGVELLKSTMNSTSKNFRQSVDMLDAEQISDVIPRKK